MICVRLRGYEYVTSKTGAQESDSSLYIIIIVRRCKKISPVYLTIFRIQPKCDMGIASDVKFTDISVSACRSGWVGQEPFSGESPRWSSNLG